MANADKLTFLQDDGGRAAAGFKGETGDCVTRSIAIATGQSYADVYALVNQFSAKERSGSRKRGKSSARTGVHKPTTRKIMDALGWKWTPTMQIGSGCKVHLHDGEVPMGRLVVSVSRHLTAMIDGVIHDTFDPRRDVHACRPDDGGPLKSGEWRNPNGIWSIQRRCVYGYWSAP